MKKQKISIGTVDIGRLEKKYVNEVLNSTYITQGKYVEKFERAVAKAHKKKYGIMVSSGQNALELALRTMIQAKKIPEGGRIGVPAITYSSTINAIINTGLHPVLIDVTPELEMKDTINEKAFDAFLPVHLFGGGYKFKSKKPIIEDACEGIFNPNIGYGDITCLSFFASHSLCCGEGGMCLTDNKKLYNLMKQIRYHGRELDNKNFRYDVIGTSFKSTEMNAAMGLAQMERKSSLMNKRLRNGQYLLHHLRNVSDDLVPLIFDENHKFFMFPLWYNGDRDKLVAYLNKWGIDTRDLLPITNQKAYKKYFKNNDLDSELECAQGFNNQAFYIGCHTKLSMKDLQYIVKIFKRYFEK